MGGSINNHLFPHVLLRLSPDVFFHPLWMYYFPRSAAVSTEIIQKLQPPIQRLLKDGDYRSAAQLMLVCAALQKRYGDPRFAVGTTQKVWSLGQSKKMPEIASWAAWGGCAICAEMGEFCQAAEYLERLRITLDTSDDWVLASTLEIVRNSLLEDDTDQGSVREMLNWMRSWGEPAYKVSGNGESNGNSWLAQPQRYSSKRLRRFSKAWWKVLIKMIFQFITGERPLWVEPEIQVLQAPVVVHTVKAESQHQPPGLPEPSLPADHEESGERLDPEPEDHSPPSASGEGGLNLKFYCLGNFRLYQNDEWVYRWVSRKALSVLKYLVVYHPDPVSKDVLMDSLWPDADPESARRNLHQAIYTLRHTLKEAAPDVQHVLFEKEHYSLNPQMKIWMDFVEFERRYQEGQQMEEAQQTYDAIRAYETAELLYRGDFMGDDLYEDLPASRRQYFWTMYLSNAYHLSKCYLKLGQIRAAIVLNQRVLERDKTQETAHQNLIKCYIQQGQRNLAIRQYLSCVQILKEELDIPPSAETRAIYQKIKLM